MNQVISRNIETIQYLPFADWISTFRPRDGTSMACGIPERYLHFRFIDKDWERIKTVDDSRIWSAVQDEGSIHLVRGSQNASSVAYLVTEVGWDADTIFHVDVPVDPSIDESSLDMRSIVCEYGCQVMQDNIVKAYFDSGYFSHWYCTWCGSTCNDD